MIRKFVHLFLFYRAFAFTAGVQFFPEQHTVIARHSPVPPVAAVLDSFSCPER